MSPIEILRKYFSNTSDPDPQAVVEILSSGGFVIVPRIPTEGMIEAAYYEALGENAAGVWEEMVAFSETGKNYEQRMKEINPNWPKDS